jgi:WD40 repeat protein
MPRLQGAVELQGDRGAVARIVPLPDGEFIATAGYDENVRVFAAATGALLRTLVGHESYARGLAALGGDMVVSGEDRGGLRVWNARTGECAGEYNLGRLVSAVAALDGRRFVAAANTDLVVFEHRGGRGVTEVCRVPSAHAHCIWDLSVCGARLASASWDKTAAVWDGRSLERIAVLEGHTDFVLGVAMDRRRVVTCSRDCAVSVYDAETFARVRIVYYWHVGWVLSVALVSCDHLLSSSYDKTVCIADLASTTQISRTPRLCEMKCAAVTRDSRLALAGSARRIQLLPPPVEIAPVFLCHNAAAHPWPALRALHAIETGSHPGVMRRMLARKGSSFLRR